MRIFELENQLPPMPQVAKPGEKLTKNPDGTTTYTGAFGTITYDSQGTAIDHNTPTVSGLNRQQNLKTGATKTNYSAGPLQTSQTQDKTGKVTKTSAKYDVGLGTMSQDQEDGITTRTWQARSSDLDPVQARDLVKNKDVYDRAVKEQEVEEPAPVQQPAVAAAAQPAAEPEPTQKDIQDIQGLLGTIDPQKEQPQSLLKKLTGWMQQYPLLDKVTDIIPQTRLVKAIAKAADALDSGDPKLALNSLAGAVGGNIAQAARAVNVGSALAQGDVKQAALAAGGNVATAAKTVSAAQNLAQGNLAGAAAQFNPTAGKVVGATQQALAGQTPDELQRIKQLANLAQPSSNV